MRRDQCDVRSTGRFDSVTMTYLAVSVTALCHMHNHVSATRDISSHSITVSTRPPSINTVYMLRAIGLRRCAVERSLVHDIDQSRCTVDGQ